MNARQLAHVGLGLIGIMALVYALSGFATLAAILGSGEPAGSVLLAVGIPFALLLGLSYVLVFHNSALASAIAPDAGGADSEGAPDLARILVVLLGVHFLVIALPSLLNAVLAFLAAGEFRQTPSAAGLIRSFIGSAVQGAIAVFLIMRPDRLLEFVRRPLPAQTG